LGIAVSESALQGMLNDFTESLWTYLFDFFFIQFYSVEFLRESAILDNLGGESRFSFKELQRSIEIFLIQIFAIKNMEMLFTLREFLLIFPYLLHSVNGVHEEFSQ